MDLLPTDDQLALRDGVRAFLHGRFPLDDVAALEASRVVDRERWRQLADLGVFSLAGDGLGMREAVMVFEELGRTLVPGPLVGTALAASLGVEGAADGSTVVGVLEPGLTGGDGDRHEAVVEHTESLDAALSIADDGMRLIPAERLHARALARPLDALTPISLVSCCVLDDHPAGDLLTDGEVAARAVREGTLLTAALSVGVAAAATDLAVGYAHEREQFGRPIGSFQAVKHLLADMFVHADVARAAVHAAACTLDGASHDDPRRAVSAAKMMASQAGMFCGRTGIQVHGGMGFTWDVHAQRYWKRAVVLACSFGSVDHHAEELAACL